MRSRVLIAVLFLLLGAAPAPAGAQWPSVVLVPWATYAEMIAMCLPPEAELVERTEDSEDRPGGTVAFRIRDAHFGLARIPRDTPLRHAAYPTLSDESGQPMTLVSYRLPNAPEYSENPQRIAQWTRDVATGVGCFYVVTSPLGDSR